jgi:hypothetical protein
MATTLYCGSEALEHGSILNHQTPNQRYLTLGDLAVAMLLFQQAKPAKTLGGRFSGMMGPLGKRSSLTVRWP